MTRPNLVAFSGEHIKQLECRMTGDLRLKSKMAAGNVIQNFKIKVFLADLFQEFAGTPMESHFFGEECCLFKWLSYEL